ncbi:MAG: hypothetical protein GY866_19300 [Proteobacteria bacterium]|nr:hypothetical protein [Pseudomonadota bacterium]
MKTEIRLYCLATLVAVLGIYLFDQKLDLAAWKGIMLIIGGVLTMNILSKSALH